jgi:hypothetical protein
MVANAFAGLNAAPSKPATKKSGAKATVNIEGLKALAALDTMIKALEAAKSLFDTSIKDGPMTDFFVEQGRALKRAPESFTGVEDEATASCQFKAKGSNTTLPDEVAERFDALKVRYETVHDVPATAMINPAHAADEKLAAKLIKFIQKNDEYPADYLVIQEGRSRKVATEDSMVDVFSLAREEDTRELLKMVGTLAIRPKFNGDHAAAFEIVKKALGLDKPAKK